MKKLTGFLLRYVIEDDKAVRDNRASELYLQNIFTAKMEGKFDSAKHFFQNVCHTLLQKILPNGDVNPLHIKSSIGGMKL